MRHTPVLVNLAWADQGVFWDGGAKNLESQVLAPLVAPDEMGESIAGVVETVQKDVHYVAAFTSAFGDELVTPARVAQALAQFIRSLESFNSRYDRFVQSEGEFTQAEYLGLEVFNRACRSCHATDLFTDHQFHNNGLDTRFSDADELQHHGRARVTGDDVDLGKFKTPTLRNIAASAPYMHDGRLASLQQVVEHYRNGVQLSATLDASLIGEDGVGLKMTDAEAAALVAFLHTLTDDDFLESTQFGPPLDIRSSLP